MDQNNSVLAQGTNAGLKNFIIGKLWVNSKDGSRPGALRISRDLPKDIILTKGTTLFLNTNEKRDGKQDADYSVSVLLPTAVANELIEAQKVSIAERASEALGANPLL